MHHFRHSRPLFSASRSYCVNNFYNRCARNCIPYAYRLQSQLLWLSKIYHIQRDFFRDRPLDKLNTLYKLPHFLLRPTVLELFGDN